MHRTAKKTDMSAVVKIAETIRLNVQEPQLKLLRIGFLIYVLSESEYARRENPYFIISLEDSTIEGFLICYDSIFLRDLVKDGSISHQDGIIKFLFDEEEGSFIFGDQIAVGPSATRQGLGRDLMLDMFERMRKANIPRMFVTVLHAPIRNDVSIAFCEELGAQCVKEATNKDSLTWGIYSFEP